MESTLVLKPVKQQLTAPNEVDTVSTDRPFIQANTIESTLNDIRTHHIIPVYVKDNEPLISHSDFIEATASIVTDVFHGEQILKPAIRMSHPIKGRIPGARTSRHTSS